ncbi:MULTISPECIES: hypothetical protein [unclassified Vibrio]|uniref:hypothetical protein n=1 Tax=unclassified Vibrio TaxID=2614977 RepID=UPI002554B8D0|nr:MULTISPECIES: hypothetical protein [unclassified Vibrio]MDK9792191.1 hypothetical protein [Vibrio sp. D431a]MDK9805642.1 hypothetical protein [Vibrio sp. D406a]
MDKRTVHFISYPTSDLACIAAQLLFSRSSDRYHISYERLPNEEDCGDTLDCFGYFGYLFLDASDEIEPGYDYVIDINYAMHRVGRRREAYQKNLYWEVTCNQNAIEELQNHVSYFSSRCDVIL